MSPAPKLPAAAVTFIKSADTQTTTDKTRVQLEQLLDRYGARSFGYSRTFDERGFARIVIEFALPVDLGGEASIPVQIPMEVGRVYDRIVGARKSTPTVRERPALIARAERVAWRQLYLFVDASLAAVALGITTLEEAFFAHALVGTPDGRVGRAGDFVRGLRESGKLLAIPATTGGAR